MIEGLTETLIWAEEEGVYLPPSSSGRTVEDTISAGLEYLLNTQTPDGTWEGAFPDYVTEENLLTTYALHSILLAVRSGAYVDESLIRASVEHLVSQIMENDGGVPREPGRLPDPLTTALALYVIKEYVNSGYGTLDGQAEQAMGAAAQWLANHAVEDNEDMVHWWIDYYVWSGSTSVVTATAIKALYSVQGATPLITKGLNWLIEHHSHWLYSSTRTGAVVVGTLDLLSEAYHTSTAANVEVYLNGELVWEGSIQSGEKASMSLETGVGANNITIVVSGTGKVYAIVTTTYWTSAQASLSPAATEHGSTEPLYSLSGPGASGSSGGLLLEWNISEPLDDGRLPTMLRIQAPCEMLYMIVEIPPTSRLHCRARADPRARLCC